MTALYFQLVSLLVLFITVKNSFSLINGFRPTRTHTNSRVSTSKSYSTYRTLRTSGNIQLNRNSRNVLGNVPRNVLVLKSILDDDEVYTDFETMNSDSELEKKMARELYDELRAGKIKIIVFLSRLTVASRSN